MPADASNLPSDAWPDPQREPVWHRADDPITSLGNAAAEPWLSRHALPAIITDPGRQRDVNDSCCRFVIGDRVFDGARSLLSLADGLRGDAAGELACQQASEALARAFRDEVGLSATDTLLYALQSARQAVASLGDHDPALARLPTALAAVLVQGQLFVAASSASCQIHLLRQGRLTRLQGATLQDQPGSLIIGDPTQLCSGQLLPGDRFLLSTASLHPLIAAPSIALLMANPSAADAAAHLVDEARRQALDGSLTLAVWEPHREPNAQPGADWPTFAQLVS